MISRQYSRAYAHHEAGSQTRQVAYQPNPNNRSNLSRAERKALNHCAHVAREQIRAHVARAQVPAPTVVVK